VFIANITCADDCDVGYRHMDLEKSG